jgi:DNA-directed RNA polymerase subunit omega
MTEENGWTNQVDSKYRLVLLAAQRSKQLQRGAHPRVRSAAKKNTRIALEEAQQGELQYLALSKLDGTAE